MKHLKMYELFSFGKHSDDGLYYWTKDEMTRLKNENFNPPKHFVPRYGATDEYMSTQPWIYTPEFFKYFSKFVVSKRATIESGREDWFFLVNLTKMNDRIIEKEFDVLEDVFNYLEKMKHKNTPTHQELG